MRYTKNGSGTEIIEENNFYPFGLKHEGYNAQTGNPSYNYQYNGKELQKETGWSDYGARMYMSDIGRWGVIDTLAETSRRFTPYNYAYNNPISFIDPDGRSPLTDLFNLSGRKIGTDGVNNGVKMVVTDNSEARRISRTSGNINLSDVRSGVTLPSDTALQESVNVLNRAIANGGQREESSLVMNNGTVIQGETGPIPTIVDGVQIAPSRLPDLPLGTTTADVETSIHSHPITVAQVGDQVFPQSASVPSTGPGSDGPTFHQYTLILLLVHLGQLQV